jgi:hypothetical protein
VLKVTVNEITKINKVRIKDFLNLTIALLDKLDRVIRRVIRNVSKIKDKDKVSHINIL